MTPRSPRSVLSDIVERRGRGEQAHDKLVVNRDRNWLLGLTLHSFAKAADGKPLSDVEEHIVSTYRHNGFTDDEISEQAQLWRELSDDARAKMFPERFAQLSDDEDYTQQSLADDAQSIVDMVHSMPATTQWDVDALMDGRATLRDFPLPGKSVIREHGLHMLTATGSDALLQAQPRTTQPRTFKIKATKFHCNDRDTDHKWGPSNEVFWIFGTVGGGDVNTTNTSVYGDVDNNETFYLSSSEGNIWTRDGARAPIPDGDMGIYISLTEHDEGDVDRTTKAVGAAFASAAGVLTAGGVTAWIGALTLGVGGVVTWLISMGDDDPIAEETIVLNRALIESMVPDQMGGKWEITRKFANNDADYDLTVVVYGRKSRWEHMYG